MIKQEKEVFVLDLGGSVFAPSGNGKKGIDFNYLNRFEEFIRKQVSEKKRQFYIITGGGYVAREYRDAAVKAAGSDLTDDDLDWLGIHASRLNAHLLRTIFRDIAYGRILKHYDMVDKKAVDSVVVCAGWKPGWSTDYCSVLVAGDYGVDMVVNLTNIDYVYDKDPKKYRQARPIKRISWDEVIKLVGDEWRPGMNTPFDPKASRLAKKRGLKVIVVNGHDFGNISKVFEGEKFKGTIIE